MMGSCLSPGKGCEVPVPLEGATAGVRCGVLTFGCTQHSSLSNVDAYGRDPK